MVPEPRPCARAHICLLCVPAAACYACLLPKSMIGLLRGDAVRDDVIDEYVQDLDLHDHVEKVNRYLLSQLQQQS
jgi:hypothetical protein